MGINGLKFLDNLPIYLGFKFDWEVGLSYYYRKNQLLDILEAPAGVSSDQLLGAVKRVIGVRHLRLKKHVNDLDGIILPPVASSRVDMFRGFSKNDLCTYFAGHYINRGKYTRYPDYEPDIAKIYIGAEFTDFDRYREFIRRFDKKRRRVLEYFLDREGTFIGPLRGSYREIGFYKKAIFRYTLLELVEDNIITVRRGAIVINDITKWHLEPNMDRRDQIGSDIGLYL